jgi:hypothetical protein
MLCISIVYNNCRSTALAVTAITLTIALHHSSLLHQNITDTVARARSTASTYLRCCTDTVRTTDTNACMLCLHNNATTPYSIETVTTALTLCKTSHNRVTCILTLGESCMSAAAL